MKLIMFLSLFSLFLTNIFAQMETFDIIAYSQHHTTSHYG
jgi:hypothetical protein